nr:unnamed protein product [Callosobruchus chinensis]
MVTAEMIPMAPTKLSFWQKFLELHYKMLFSSTDGVQNHMYSSEPLEWPLMTRGIAYWVSSTSNAQVHLLGNIVIWYSATFGLLLYATLLIIYLLRRRRQCYDIDDATWTRFKTVGEIFMTGYLLHYIPYFFVERTLFLHHYIPAFVFKTLLFCATVEHVYFVLKRRSKLLGNLFILIIITWFVSVIHVFKKFSVFSYGTVELTTIDIVNLRWRDTWDFIIHKN